MEEMQNEKRQGKKKKKKGAQLFVTQRQGDRLFF